MSMSQSLQGTGRLLGILALSLATFMNVLDTSIANVSIPAIAGSLGASPAQGTWVITSFAVANAISVPLTGWLAQRFGSVRVFSGSVLLFVLTSWACGLASSLEMLVVARVFQGLAAGPMIPLSQTLLLASYPAHQAGRALAIWGMTTLVAPVVGPLLGAWLTETASWPWIFYINVPVGLGAAAVTWAVYRDRETQVLRRPIDGVGLALLVVWVGALQWMLDQGKELDWFASPVIVTLALVALVGAVVFVVWELTDAHPIVDLRLFAGRNFALGSLAVALAFGLFFSNIVLLPLWLQQWMGYNATNAALVLAPTGILALLLTPLVGKNLARWDARWLVTGAFLIFALVLAMRARFTTQTDLVHMMLPTLIQGAAVALFFIPLTAIILSDVPPESVAAATGLTNFLRMTAGAMATSVLTTFWDRRAALHHAHLTEQLPVGDPEVQSALTLLTRAGLSESAALAQMNRVIDQQAFTRAMDDLAWVSAGLFIVLVGLLWSTKRPGRPVASSVDAS
jgi:DHA2 family multidrug resistance protein